MVQVGATMFAGGTFSEVRTPSGVSPGGTFVRRNVFGFNATTGVVSAFAPNPNGEVWGLATDGTSLWVGGQFTNVAGIARRGVFKVNPSTGAVDAAFNAGLTSGMVNELAYLNGRLIIGGTFPGALRAVNPATGANTNYLNLGISGRIGSTGPSSVYRFAITPGGTRLVAIGNFTTVGGQTRHRAFMATLSATSATLNPWYYAPLQNFCRDVDYAAYLRDVDFSPDGSYFVMVATGYIPARGGVGRDVCDAAARFETATANPTRPTWINYTGGDTLHSVAVTDVAVYVQGHQRWLNNPQGANSAGPGAVERPGIGAINPTTGLALSWTVNKARGVGGKDLLLTSQGLWVPSDTAVIAGETRRRIALLPF